MEAYALHEVQQKGRTLVLRAKIGLTGPDASKRTSWANIARCGEWKGHPAGEFQVTEEHLRACIEYFDGQENPVPFDYEHASTIEGKAAPASGWVQKLELRGDRLWALVEWTEEAWKYIKNGQYKYSSAVLFFDVPDRESGEPYKCRLHSVALTNTPFMDGLQAIALKEKIITMAVKEVRGPDLEKLVSECVRDLASEGRLVDSDDVLDLLGTRYGSRYDWDDKEAEKMAKRYLGSRGRRSKESGPSSGAVRSLKMKISKKALIKMLQSVGASELSLEAWTKQLEAAAAAMEGDEEIAAPEEAVEEEVAEMAQKPRKTKNSETVPAAVAADEPAAIPAAEPAAVPAAEATPAPQSVAAAEPYDMQACATLGARLAEASGMSPEELTAAVESNLEAVLAALKGGGEGAPAPDAAAMDPAIQALKEEDEAMMENKLAAAEAKIAALEPTVKQLSERLANYEKADAARAKAVLEGEIDKLIEDKRLAPEAKESMVKFAEKDADGFRKLAATLRPIFPQGAEASALPSAKPAPGAPLDAKHPRVMALKETFKRAGLKDEAVIEKYVRAELAKEEV